MGRYTDASVAQVRDAVRLEELAGEFTTLRRSATDKFVGLCPLHDERTGSFTVTPSRQLFRCFGCDAGGDVITFVQQKLGMDFVAAVEHLATRAGIELRRESETPAQRARRERHIRLLSLLERAAAFYAHHLRSSTGQSARAYLVDERGLGDEILRAFGVGMAPAGPRAMIDAAARAGFSEEELLAAGLAQRRSGKAPAQDRFRDRITFPTADWRGKTVGFGARRRETRGAKYVNSPQGAVYHKGRLLYGCSQARPHAAKAGAVILVEGYTDVLAFHQAGVRNTVGAMGTAVTEEQVALLRRMAPTVVFVLDGDRSGVKAALRAGALAQAADLEVKVAALPKGSDPAELAIAGHGDAIDELLHGAVSLSRFGVTAAIDAADLSSAEGKDALIAVLRPLLVTVPPSVLREELLDHVAGVLGFNRDLVTAWMTQGAAPPPEPSGPAPGGVDVDERLRLRQAVQDPQLRAALDPSGFQHYVYRRAARHLRDHPHDATSALPADDHELARLFALLLST